MRRLVVICLIFLICLIWMEALTGMRIQLAALEKQASALKPISFEALPKSAKADLRRQILGAASPSTQHGDVP